MRKNLRLLLTALLCAVMGQAMAQEVTLDFTSNDVWKFPAGTSNKATAVATFTNDGYTITLADGYYYNTGYLMLTSGASLSLPAFNFAVSTIEVVGKSGASTGTIENFYVGEDAVSTECTGSTGTNKFDINANHQAAGNIYTLKVSSKNAQITQIKIYKAGGTTVKPTPAMYFTPNTITVAVGDDVNEPTLTYEGDGTVTYSSDNEKVATVDPKTGDVDVVAAGVANIIASATATSNYKENSASYKITAADPQTSHEVVDGTFDFTDTQNYGSGLRPKDNTGYGDGKDYEPNSSTWTAGNVTLLVEGKYRWWYAATGNTLRLYSNIVDEVQTSKMTISVPAGKTITQIDLSGSSLAFTANVGEFASSKWTGEAQSVVLTYSGSGTKQIKTITVTYSDGTTPVEKQKPTMKFSTNYITIIKGNTFPAPELTYDGDGTVTYASDNEEVATVNATTGAVTIIGVGTAVITASATETANYEAATATYTISVAEPQGTHEVVDGTFDFTDATDYGSGLTPTGDTNLYIYDSKTWTAGNVTLVTEGKYRWWLNANGNTLRLYSTIGKDDPEGTPQGTKITISVPSGYTINKIDFTGSDISFNANTGEFANNAWTGSAQSVVLSYAKNSQIKTITVDYGKNRLDPQLAWSAETAEATLGQAFTAPTLSKAQNYNGVINYSSSNENVATISTAGAVTIVGAGTTTITATAPSSDTNIESTASYTLTVTDPNASYVTYDFTGTNDYGTGLEPSSDGGKYTTEDYTWTNDPVSLVTSGKYRWWYNSKGNTLRLYTTIPKDDEEGTPETTKLTFSVPEGKSITAIEFEVGVNDAFTADKGTFSGKSWSGDAQTVVLTLANGTPYISTIKVSHKDASTTGLPGDADEDGSVSLADIMLVVDAILTDDTSHLNLTNADIDKSGGLSLSDIMGIVAIILAQ